MVKAVNDVGEPNMGTLNVQAGGRSILADTHRTGLRNQDAVHEHASAKREFAPQSNYLSGPFLGIACSVTITNATNEISGPYGEIHKYNGPKFSTYKLRVWVPEMNANACVPTILPGQTGWKDENYKSIDQLPVFLGEHTHGRGANQVKVGDVVVVDYYDTNIPHLGGKFLGVAHDTKRSWKGGRGRAKDAFAETRTKHLVSSVIKDIGDEINYDVDITKTCTESEQAYYRAARHPEPIWDPSTIADEMAYAPGCTGDGRFKLDAGHLTKLQIVVDKKPLTKRSLVWVKSNNPSALFQVHKRAELAFRMVFRQLELLYEDNDKAIKNFKIEQARGWRPPADSKKYGPCARNDKYEPVKNLDGVTECKEKDTSDVLPWPLGYSRHSFGFALDLNWDDNKQLSGGPLPVPYTPGPDGILGTADDVKSEGQTTQDGNYYYNWLYVRSSPTPANATRIPDKVIQIFKYYGFNWGGHYKRKDLHHFEFAADPERMITSYVKGVLYAYENSQEYKRLIIGRRTDIWNKALIAAAKKMKLPGTGGQAGGIPFEPFKKGS